MYQSEEEKKTPKHVGRMTLEHAMKEHIRPGWALLPLEDDNVKKTASLARFILTELDTRVAQERNPKKLKRKGVKEIYLNPGHSLAHQKSLLEKAWSFLMQIVQPVSVEFHVHATLPQALKRQKPNFRAEDLQSDVDFIHLRPDVIGQALPSPSGIAIKPQAVGTDFCWVVYGPGLVSKYLIPGKAKQVTLEERFKKIQRKLALRIKTQKAFQHKLDEKGEGIPLKEERKVARQALKDAGEWQSIRGQRTALWNQLAQDNPEIAAAMKKDNRFKGVSPADILRAYDHKSIAASRSKLAHKLEDPDKLARPNSESISSRVES